MLPVLFFLYPSESANATKIETTITPASHPPVIDGTLDDTAWRNLEPISRIVCNLTITREDFYRSFGGKRSYVQTIFWNKISCQIKPSMFVRGIFQYNSLEEVSSASCLFSYEYNPLSNIYVGANFNDFSRWDRMEDCGKAFFKMSYFWRL
jgi:hypothetical protein